MNKKNEKNKTKDDCNSCYNRLHSENYFGSKIIIIGGVGGWGEIC